MNKISISVALAMLLGQSAWAATVTVNDVQEGNVSTYFASTSMEKETHVIGVYTTASGQVGSHHMPGTAHVHVTGTSDVPIKLVLSSYEPTNWVLDGDGVSGIGLLFLNGYDKSSVTGIDGFKVVDKTGLGNYLATCAIAWPADNSGCDTPGLVQGLYDISNATVTSFTGVYRASDFSVRLSAVPEASAVFYCLAGLLTAAWLRRRPPQSLKGVNSPL